MQRGWSQARHHAPRQRAFSLQAHAARGGSTREALESITFNDPGFPVAANVDARLLRRGPEVRDALIRQVTGAVRWVECIELLKQSGATHYIEVGPGKVLAGLNGKIDRSLRDHARR